MKPMCAQIRVYVNPQGYGLSPDDRVVLVQMVLTYVRVDSAELAGEIGGKFKPRWYAVNTSTGKALGDSKVRILLNAGIEFIA